MALRSIFFPQFCHALQAARLQCLGSLNLRFTVVETKGILTLVSKIKFAGVLCSRQLPLAEPITADFAYGQSISDAARSSGLCRMMPACPHATHGSSLHRFCGIQETVVQKYFLRSKLFSSWHLVATCSTTGPAETLVQHRVRGQQHDAARPSW